MPVKGMWLTQGAFTLITWFIAFSTAFLLIKTIEKKEIPSIGLLWTDVSS